MTSTSEIKKLEQGRAEFAYKCAYEGKEIINGKEIDNVYYHDDKYKSYVQKIPTMILTNGLGQTLAFIKAKMKLNPAKNKEETEKKDDRNRKKPQNAYGLIYKHITNYITSNSTARIRMPSNRDDLTEWVISCDSTNYRYITQELLAFLNWLKRFAEGMIEGEGK